MTAPYRVIAGPDGHLANLRPFTGNSMSAGWHIPVADRAAHPLNRVYSVSYDDPGAIPADRHGSAPVYVVMSYRTPVAVHDPETGRSVVSPNCWGPTTGKHLSYCRTWLPAVISEDESALDGIGPGCRVKYRRPNADSLPPESPRYVLGRVKETYPLSRRVVVRPSYGYGAALETLPVGEVELV